MTSSTHTVNLHSKHKPKSLRVFLGNNAESTKAQVGYRRGSGSRIKGNYSQGL